MTVTPARVHYGSEDGRCQSPRKKPGFPIYLPKPHSCVLNTSHWIKVKWKRRSPDQQHFFPLGAAVINLVVFHPRPPASPCFRLLKAFSSLCSGGGEAVLITERKRGERTEKHDLRVWICRTIEGISARMQMCVNAKQSTATQMIFFVIFMVPWNKKPLREKIMRSTVLYPGNLSRLKVSVKCTDSPSFWQQGEKIGTTLKCVKYRAGAVRGLA